MTSTTSRLLLAACLAACALFQAAPAQAQSSTRDQIRLIEQEYARQTGGRSIPDNQLEYYLDRMDQGWSMSQVSTDIATSRRTYARTAWRPAQGWVAREVICTSLEGRYRECAAPFRGTAVVTQQLSRAACVQGRTWGQKPGLIWVDDGCRARFGIVRNAGTNPPRGMVVCASNRGAYRECNTGIRGRVVLVNRLNNSAACIEGRTWGQKPGIVWVDDGCRAQFRSDGRPGWRDDRTDRRDGRAWVRDPNYGVDCYATGTGRTVCQWDTRYGTPTIVRRVAGTCVQGRDWGYDRNGELWVTAGCRARFGYAATSDVAFVRDPNYSVTCYATGTGRTVCDWDSRYGTPTLLRREAGECIEGRDWGYDRTGDLWVTAGCRARFGYR
jgi:hypothetical protein